MTFRVTYQGHPGTYWDQPEPAEFVATCPVTGKDEDMASMDMFAGAGDEIEVSCSCGTDHTITVPDTEPDPYDAWRERRDWDDA